MYITVDFNLADRYLSSIFQISIIKWDCELDDPMVEYFNSYINPECEIEEFLIEKYNLKNVDFSKYPTIREIWKDIYFLLNNNVVFFHNPNQSIFHLLNLCNIEKLDFPNIIYCSSQSLAKKTWKNLSDYKISKICDYLNIPCNTTNSWDDALSMIFIIETSIFKNNTNHIDLFEKIGFSGGMVLNGEKKPYKVKKNKGLNKYIAKLNLSIGKNNIEELEIVI